MTAAGQSGAMSEEVNAEALKFRECGLAFIGNFASVGAMLCLAPYALTAYGSVLKANGK